MKKISLKRIFAVILLFFAVTNAEAKDIKLSVSAGEIEKYIPAVLQEVSLLPKKVGNQIYCFEIASIDKKSAFHNLKLKEHDCIISITTETAVMIKGKTEISRETIMLNNPENLSDLITKLAGIRMAIVKFTRHSKMVEQKYLVNYVN